MRYVARLLQISTRLFRPSIHRGLQSADPAAALRTRLHAVARALAFPRTGATFDMTHSVPSVPNPARRREHEEFEGIHSGCTTCPKNCCAIEPLGGT